MISGLLDYFFRNGKMMFWKESKICSEGAKVLLTTSLRSHELVCEPEREDFWDSGYLGSESIACAWNC